MEPVGPNGEFAYKVDVEMELQISASFHELFGGMAMTWSFAILPCSDVPIPSTFEPHSL
jgi:hypothetical protein